MSRSKDLSDTERLLFITLSNIGDLVMTTPVLEALHIAYPTSRIDIVADRRSSELLQACPYRGEIFLKNKRAGWREQLAFVNRLRQRRYGLVVDLRGPVLGRLLRADTRVFKQRRFNPGEHAVEHHYSALKQLSGIPKTIPNTKIWIDDEVKSRAAKLLGNSCGEKILALAPGANWPGKIWPLTSYASVVENIQDHFSTLAIFGSEQDRPLGDTLCAESPISSINLAGKTNLLEAAACLQHANAFIGNDSGLGHIAAAVNVPSVTVFGPGEPARYRPWGPRATIIEARDGRLENLPAEAVAEHLLSHLRDHG